MSHVTQRSRTPPRKRHSQAESVLSCLSPSTSAKRRYRRRLRDMGREILLHVKKPKTEVVISRDILLSYRLVDDPKLCKAVVPKMPECAGEPAPASTQMHLPSDLGDFATVAMAAFPAPLAIDQHFEDIACPSTSRDDDSVWTAQQRANAFRSQCSSVNLFTAQDYIAKLEADVLDWALFAGSMTTTYFELLGNVCDRCLSTLDTNAIRSSKGLNPDAEVFCPAVRDQVSHGDLRSMPNSAWLPIWSQFGSVKCEKCNFSLDDCCCEDILCRACYKNLKVCCCDNATSFARECLECGWVETGYSLLSNHMSTLAAFCCEECGNPLSRESSEPLWVDAFDRCGKCLQYIDQSEIVPCESVDCLTDGMFHERCMQRVGQFLQCDTCREAAVDLPSSSNDEEGEEEEENDSDISEATEMSKESG